MDAAIDVDGKRLHDFHEAAESFLVGEKAPMGWEWLHEFYRSIEDESGAYGGREWAESRAKRGIVQASLLLDAAKRSNVRGYVVHTSYVEDAETGRLYAEGALNLQSCLREVKTAALAGYWDLDIDCAHCMILSQMAGRLGVTTSAINHYTANKRLVRESVAESAGISIRAAKFVLNALIYGARLAPFGEIDKVIGRVALDKLKDNEFVQAIRDDIKAATPNILDAYRDNSRNWKDTLVSDAGRKINTRGRSDDSLLSFLCQGAESELLKACMDFGLDIRLLSHDGFVSAHPVDLEALQSHCLKVTGYAVTFTKSQLFFSAAQVAADEQE